MSKDAVINKWGDTPAFLGGLNVYILYDRSGSMASKEEEAVPAMNAYVEALDPDTVVTVVAFDSVQPHLLVRDHVRVYDYHPIAIETVKARAMTPLYDAMGWITNKILQDNPSRAVLVVQTDGEENLSREYDFASVKRQIENLNNKGYQLVFLGSEFKNVGIVSSSLGVGLGNVINRTKGYYDATSVSMAASTRAYGATGKNINYTDIQKSALGDIDTLSSQKKIKVDTTNSA